MRVFAASLGFPIRALDIFVNLSPCYRNRSRFASRWCRVDECDVGGTRSWGTAVDE